MRPVPLCLFYITVGNYKFLLWKKNSTSKPFFSTTLGLIDDLMTHFRAANPNLMPQGKNLELLYVFPRATWVTCVQRPDGFLFRSRYCNYPHSSHFTWPPKHLVPFLINRKCQSRLESRISVYILGIPYQWFSR